MTRPFTRADRVAAFRVATSIFAERYQSAIATGMTDSELKDALKRSLGMFGGRGGPDEPHITYQGDGLKIWASWHVHNHVQERPMVQGPATVAMAREIYGIADPDDDQLSFFKR